MEDYIKEVQEKWGGWLRAGICPECDGSGGRQISEDEAVQCQWCDERNKLIPTLLTQARKKWLEEVLAVVESSSCMGCFTNNEVIRKIKALEK